MTLRIDHTCVPLTAYLTAYLTVYLTVYLTRVQPGHGHVEAVVYLRRKDHIKDQQRHLVDLSILAGLLHRM